MLGLVVTLIVVGLVLGVFIPPFGFIVAAVGLVLLVLYLAGWKRRSTPDAQ